MTAQAIVAVKKKSLKLNGHSHFAKERFRSLLALKDDLALYDHLLQLLFLLQGDSAKMGHAKINVPQS